MEQYGVCVDCYWYELCKKKENFVKRRQCQYRFLAEMIYRELVKLSLFQGKGVVCKELIFKRLGFEKAEEFYRYLRDNSAMFERQREIERRLMERSREKKADQEAHQ